MPRSVGLVHQFLEVGRRAQVPVEAGEVERPVAGVAVVLEVAGAAADPAVDLLHDGEIQRAFTPRSER